MSTSIRHSNVHQSPCARVIARAEKTNQANGHENQGFLSYRSGFMPAQQPLTALPPTHQAWDDLATALPQLLRDQTLRDSVNAMPELPAHDKSLPDAYLHRASTVLSIVAHAYVHADMGGPTELPACVQRPWDTVSKRLGRDIPCLTYIDLIVYNWKHLNPADEEFRVENLSLLVPTVNNAEENVFYLTQAEILSRATPLLGGVVDAQRAVLNDDAAGLKSALATMGETLSGIGRKTLMKIAPNPTHATHVDPVVWAKSVAPLAVPLRADVPGPGGTASPLFHMMDAFIGRRAYNARLGEEAQCIRAAYPPHWRDVVAAAGEVDVAAFVASAKEPELTALWEGLKEKYRGSMGLLGMHRRKVFAYLPMAFKVGRSATIAGFKGEMAEEEWLTVHRELEKSRQERYCGGEPVTAPQAAASQLKAGKLAELGIIPIIFVIQTLVRYVVSLVAAMGAFGSSKSQPRRPPSKIYAISTLVEHSNSAVGFWFAAKGRVYDASKYLRAHPGGDKIIVSCSGRDATADLSAVSHFQEPAIAQKLARFVIGDLEVRQFGSPALRELYDFSVAMAYKMSDLHATFGNDMTFVEGKLTSEEAPGAMTAQKQRFLATMQERVGTQYVSAMASHAAAVAKSVASNTAERFDALRQGRGGSSSTTEQASEILEACKAQAVRLLKTLESVPVSADVLSSSQQSAVQRALESIAGLLESLVR